MEIKDIRIFLSNYLNQEIIYIPNPGNAGDSLIAFGTIQTFNELGLNWKMGSISNKYHNKTLFYAGGGNLVGGLYSNCKKFINKNKNDNKIIILPHTIKSEGIFLSNLNDNIIIFCREETSYNYVLKVFNHKKNVYLSKDMAFYINNLNKYKIIKGNGVCNAYRTDKEKTNIKIPEDNSDLSQKFNKWGNTNKINVIKDVSLSIFDYLSKFETINTNRLHIAIAGTLLNKKVNFYSNSYYKNKSVFEYSINNIYKNTIFMINIVKIKGSNNNSINGIYKVQPLRNVDKNTKSYYKDEQYQLYRYKNKWRIAHNGEKVYLELSFCEGKEWDIDELDLKNIVKIKGSNNNSINGIYKVQPLRNVDENTKSYWKDKEHQLYRYKNIWRIAQHGVKVYIDLPCCRGKEWNIDELDLTNIESKNIFDDFTLFDVFWKNNLIYLILSINNNIVDESKLNVYLNKTKIKLKQKIIKDKYEPTLIFIYDDNSIDISKKLFIQVFFDGKEYSKEIEKIVNKEKSNFLCLTTLFKDDYNLFPNFYNYYKRQGVQHFFMYYNGLLNNKIKEIFNYTDVTLIEWNFRYWNPKKYKYHHHAQLGQMHHALYKYGKDNYEYMIFNDLDEYLFIPNIKLVEYIKLNTNINVFGFKNIWAKTKSKQKELEENLYISEPFPFRKRSKCIYMVSSIETINIHYNCTMLKKENLICDNYMFHFYNWGSKGRSIKTPISKKINLNFLYI